MRVVGVVVVLVQRPSPSTTLDVTWARPPAGQQQQEEDVVGLLSEVASGRLTVCHTIILTPTIASPRLHNVILALQHILTNTFLTYDVEAFLENTSPPRQIVRHRPPLSDGTYCVTYFILAPLTLLPLALTAIPKTNWFPGATRYFVCYTGRSLAVRTLQEDPFLLASYNTLYVSHNEHHDPKNTRSWALDLFSNCPFCRGGEPEVIHRNRWSPRRGLQERSDLFPDLFTDFNGHIFRAVTLNFPPFSHYSAGNSTYPLVMEDCLDKRIVDTIAKIHNFTYLVFEPADGKWGYQLDNGSFTGVLGEIQTNKKDFSLDLSITAEREEVIDFTIGYHWEPLTFVTSKPKPLPQWLALVRPFQSYVWLCLLLVTAAGGPVLWLLQRLSGNSFPLPSAVFLVFASMMAQGQRWPSSSMVRVFSVFWLLFCLVATVCYVGNLTAFLTVPALSPTIDRLEDLLDSNFVWGINSFGAADYQLFKTSKVPLYQEIFRGLTFCPSLVECVQRALKERFAFISFKTYLRDAIAMHFVDKNGDTRVYLAKDSFFPADTGYAVQKGSPMKRVFDGILKRLLGGGFVAKWMSNLIEQHTLTTRRRAAEAAGMRGEMEATQERANLSLTLYHLQGVFLVYTAGLILADLVFIWELAFKSLSRSMRQVG
ncbi:glutamate receptor ionotropic, delta-1 [Procambarus clarkii]|uniref:glutamate receptor ionotropic, delta-1 n=1 Tax=Procambarus clarkii TaxID=6728 RepID=UPI0037436FA0